MRQAIVYRLAVLLAPVRGQAGFIGAIVSAGLNVLGSITGSGSGSQPAPPPPPPPQETGFGKMLPIIVIGGFAFLVLMIVLLFVRK